MCKILMLLLWPDKCQKCLTWGFRSKTAEQAPTRSLLTRSAMELSRLAFMTSQFPSHISMFSHELTWSTGSRPATSGPPPSLSATFWKTIQHCIKGIALKKT